MKNFFLDLSTFSLIKKWGYALCFAYAMTFFLLFPPLIKATECPDINAQSSQASLWQIDSDDGVLIARLKPTKDSRFPPLNFALDIDGPTEGNILDWSISDRHNGRFGLLHYYSGSAGTHASADITRLALVDIHLGKLIEIIEGSAYVYGTRYLEDDNGKTTQQPYAYCQQTKVRWTGEHLLYIEDGNEYAIDLFTDKLIYPSVRFDAKRFTQPPAFVKAFAQSVVKLLQSAENQVLFDRWLQGKVAADFSCSSEYGDCNGPLPAPKSVKALATLLGFNSEQTPDMLTAMLLGPFVKVKDNEYCTATINDWVSGAGKQSFATLKSAFVKYPGETIEDRDLDLLYRSFGLLGQHQVMGNSGKIARVLSRIDNELVVSMDNLPPTHPDRDSARSLVYPWQQAHRVRTADGTVGYVQPKRNEVILDGFSPSLCIASSGNKTQITRVRNIQ